MDRDEAGGLVVSVAKSQSHQFSKTPADEILLVEGYGVAGDAHAGRTVQHLSRVRVDPTQPNLRQVHIIPSELLKEVARAGIDVPAGGLGENVLVQGIDLHALGTGARLCLGTAAVVEITGLRNPCAQIEAWRAGLLAHVLRRTADGAIERRAGVMGVVVAGGPVRPGDPVRVVAAPGPHRPLQRV